MLEYPTEMQGLIHGYGNWMSKSWMVDCIETLGKTVRSDHVEGDCTESQVEVGRFLLPLVCSQSGDEFVDLRV